MDHDVIDTLVGISPGSPLDAIRARRPEARAHAQASYRALFTAAASDDVSPEERFAVACFVTGLQAEPTTTAFYRERLVEAGAAPALRDAVQAAITQAGGQGPYGCYPAGPLSREDQPGPTWRASTELRAALGPRLTAAFEHLHMLVLHPRDAAPPSLQALLDAGWSETGIVTLSQITGFLAFQVRVVSGLRSLAATL